MSFSFADVAQLSRHLRHERLTAEHERRCIRQLNAELERLTLRLYQLSWISCQQLTNMQQLIVAKVDCTPALCCRRDRHLQNAVFVPAHSHLSHRHHHYSELVECARACPRLLAAMLQLPAPGDRLERLVDVVFASVFGSCVMAADQRGVLRLLRLLIRLQVCTVESPQLLLRRGTCSFSRLYRAFVDTLLAARLFLSVSLRRPLERLVAAGDQWLCQQSSSSSSSDLADHHQHQQTTSIDDNSRISRLVAEFVKHIALAIHCFPPSVAWLIGQLYSELSARTDSGYSVDQARAVVVDLVFTMFICTAIVSPEQHGVIRLPVNPVVRQTLIQVGQMLQVFALENWPEQWQNGGGEYQQSEGVSASAPPDDCRSLMSFILASVLSLGEQRLADDVATAGTTCLHRPAFIISAEQLQLLVHQLRQTLSAEPAPAEHAAVNQDTSEEAHSQHRHTVSSTDIGDTGLVGVFPDPCLSQTHEIAQSLGIGDGEQVVGPDRGGSEERDMLKYDSAEWLMRQRVEELLSQLPVNDIRGNGGVELVTQQTHRPAHSDEAGHGDKRRKHIFARVPSRMRHRNSSTVNSSSVQEKHQGSKQSDSDTVLQVLMLPLYADDAGCGVGLMSEKQVVSAASSSSSGNRSYYSDLLTAEASMADYSAVVAQPSQHGDPNLTKSDGPIERRLVRDLRELQVTNSDLDTCDAWSKDALAGSDSESAEVPSAHIKCVGSIECADNTRTASTNSSSECDSTSGASCRQSEPLSSTTSLAPSTVADDSDVVLSQSVHSTDSTRQTVADALTLENAGLIGKRVGNGNQSTSRSITAYRTPPVPAVSSEKRCSDASSHSRSPRNLLRSLGRRLGGGSRRHSRGSDCRSSAGGGSEEITTLDDILDKYRIAGEQQQNRSSASVQAEHSIDLQPKIPNATYCRLANAKTKLRRALSSVGVQYMGRRGVGSPSQCPLLAWLQVCQSEALLLAHRSVDHDQLTDTDEPQQNEEEQLSSTAENDESAQLHETIRCVSALSEADRRVVLQQLREELSGRRRCYSDYLVASRRRLLNDCAHVRQLLAHVQRDGSRVSASLINRCVLLFLERHKHDVAKFQTNFSALPVSDEKTHQLSVYLEDLQQRLQNDSEWTTRDTGQLRLVEQAMERALLTQLYTAAVFPNGEADHCRDQLFSEHMQRLASVVTPTHHLLAIPAEFHAEAPWPGAQAEICELSAFATAADKLACVCRCCAAIVHLLQLGSGERGVTAADELTPVLVYVLIQSQPASLLSTVQYVDNFHGHRMAGQQHYWWVQFCSAVEFIKTMDC